MKDILANTEMYAIPDDPKVVRKMLVDLSQCIRGLEQQLSRLTEEHESSIVSDDHSTNGFNSENEDEAVTLASSMQNLTLNNSNSPPRHFGEASHIIMMRTAEDMKKKLVGDQALQYEERRPDFWTTYPVSSFSCLYALNTWLNSTYPTVAT